MAAKTPVKHAKHLLAKPAVPDALAYGLKEAAAMRALAAGTASAHQQQLALHWIIHRACRKDQQDWFESSARATDFAAGRRFVGLAIMELVEISLDSLKEND